MIELLSCASLIVGLITAAVIDVRTRRIPNALIAGMAVVWAVLAVTRHVFAWSGPADTISTTSSVVSALVIGGSLLAFSVAYERFTGNMSLGGGDVKLLAAVALYLGFERTLTAVLIACVVALAWNGLRRFVHREQRSFANVTSSSAAAATFAFGPAISFGAICASATLFL